LLWGEYKKDNADGYRYWRFCDLFIQHKKVNEATMHFSHKAGDIMMMNFAGDNLSNVHKASGELVSCPVLIVVLPYSGYSFAVALPNATRPNVIKALNLCLKYFSGVPLSVKCDYMKTTISKSCRYEPIFTVYHTMDTA